MKVIVTGAAGFIGSHLMKRLDANDDYQPTGLDLRYDITCKPNECYGDIRHLDWPWEEFRGQDACIHLAALASPRRSMEHPQEYIDTNITGTLNVLEACRQFGVKRFIFASSSSVYGKHNYIMSEDLCCNPMSPYAASKVAGEALCDVYRMAYGVSTSMLRFFTVYGPRCRPEMAIGKFIRLAMRDKPLPIYGSGEQQRDFTYIDDVVSGIVAAMEELPEDSGAGLFNIAGGHPVSVNTVVSLLGKIMGKKLHCVHEDAMPGDPPITRADTEWAFDRLGWRAKTAIEDGLYKTVKWFEEHPDA